MQHQCYQRAFAVAIPALFEQAFFLVVADRAGMQRYRAAICGGLESDVLAGDMRIRQFRQRLKDQFGHLVGEIVGHRRAGNEVVGHRRDRWLSHGLVDGGERGQVPGGGRLRVGGGRLIRENSASFFRARNYVSRSLVWRGGRVV